jgi:uncharacterized protein
MKSRKIKNLLRNFGMMLGSYFLFFFIVGLLKTIFPDLELDRYQQTELNSMIENSPWRFVFLAVVFAPIIEEGLFRTLIKPSRNEIIFFLCSWLLLLTLAMIPLDIHWAIKYIFIILFIIFSFIFLREFIPEIWQIKLGKYLSRNYKIIWILTSCIFGLVHISNYVEGFQIDILLFLMIVPRIIAGFFFGKIKIENRGLFWPITMHAMNNATVVIFLFPKLL